MRVTSYVKTVSLFLQCSSRSALCWSNYFITPGNVFNCSVNPEATYIDVFQINKDVNTYSATYSITELALVEAACV